MKWKHTEFRELMAELVRLYQPHTYVEIGVQHGYIFNAISPLVKRAVAVDINPMDRIVSRANVETHQLPSLEFAGRWKEPIDLLFIDADHVKESVIADFDAMLPHVRECTGLILLHDTYPVQESLLSPRYCNNAWEAARMIHMAKKYRNIEAVTLPGPWAGLTICRKAPKHLGWMK